MSIVSRSAPRRLRASTIALAGGGAAIAATGAWLLRTFDPNAPGNPFPACMFYSVTGWHCPACGLTRCLHALVHGDLPRAFSMNPLLFVLLALAPLFMAWNAGWRPPWLQRAACLAADWRPWVAVVLVYWVARNLPWWPFVLLAPAG